MKKNLASTILFMICSLTSISQNVEFVDNPKYVAQKYENGNAFEVNQQSIVVPIYKYELIDNPEYLSRIKLIDSLQARINELQNNNFGGALKSELGLSKKKNKKEIEIEELKQQISVLKKDIQPRNGYSTYTYAIPKRVNAYVPVGESERNILIIDVTRNVSSQLDGSVFTEELTQYGGGNLYYLLKKDTLIFKKNELVVEKSIRKYLGRDGVDTFSVEAGYLYKRVNDGLIFLFDGKFKNELVDEKQNEFANLLAALAINLEKSENHSNSVLVKDGEKCVLTSEIKEYLEANKNSDIIGKVNRSINQYKKNLNQQSDITVKMTKYIQIHKSYTKMTNQQRDEWEQLTKTAITIEEKMKKIPFYNSIPFQLDSRENQLHSANLDIIRYSKQAMGI